MTKAKGISSSTTMGSSLEVSISMRTHSASPPPSGFINWQEGATADSPKEKLSGQVQKDSLKLHFSSLLHNCQHFEPADALSSS